jgi:hypothetical protein
MDVSKGAKELESGVVPKYLKLKTIQLQSTICLYTKGSSSNRSLLFSEYEI